MEFKIFRNEVGGKGQELVDAYKPGQDKFFTERTLLQQKKNAGQLSGGEVLQLKRMNLFYKTQVRPIQTRIRSQQQKKTLAAMAEIDRHYSVLSKRFNRFFDPRGGGKEPFK